MPWDGSSRKWSRELIHGELQDDVDEVAAWFSNEYDVYSTTVDFFGALGGDDLCINQISRRLHAESWSTQLTG